MAAGSIEDELELSEKSSATFPRSDSTAEQEQGLLREWRDGAEEEGEDREQVASSQRHPWGSARVTAIGFTVVFVLLVGVAWLVGFPSYAKEQVEAVPATIQTNDYLLDSRWDYSAPPRTREYTWTIRDHVHNPDGVYRPMMLVNNQFPGPLIEVNEGDTIVVHVENRAVNATSLHWHGIYQNATPHMDGTVGVTQCPIAPGARFTYKFTIAGQSGTYWWHAHQGVQSSDGVHGPLIVHGRQERVLQRIQYDTDRVLLISDHYHDLSSALLWQYLMPDMENNEPVPDGGLLNGRNIRNCDTLPSRKCDNTSSHVGRPEFNLAPDQTHRLRLINVGAFAEFQVQIDEHELAVTEVDGTDVEPMSFHRININPAQRYSVVVSTNITTANDFWFRARMITKCFRTLSETLEADLLAIVRYTPEKTDTDEIPTSLDWAERLDMECRDLDTSQLVPTEVIPAPAVPDAFFFLRANFEIGRYRLTRGFFNGSSWRADAQSPTLLRALDGMAAGNSSFGAVDHGPRAFVNDRAFDLNHEMVIQTTGIQTIDILVHNFDDGNHPLHLHGYKYFVLGSGHGYPPTTFVGAEMTPELLAPMYNSLDLSNPLRRDTASVEGYGWVLIRLIADNPGAWAFHCHISWHTEAGLLMQLLTRTDELANVQVPDANLNLCSAAGIEKGMGPDDEDYRDFAK